MTTLINSSVRSPGAAARENFDCVLEWHESLSQTVGLKEFTAAQQAEEPSVVKAVVQETKLVKTNKRKDIDKGRKVKNIVPVVEQMAAEDPYACAVHKNYHGKERRPQTDCPKCWSIFKQFNPNRYQQSRRDFEFKQRKK